MQKKIKPKKCRICKAEFTPFNSMQKVCSISCSIELGKEIKKKEYNALTRELKRNQRDNDRGYWVKKAQEAVNKYIRLRDKGKPCISCDKPDNGQHQRHASHFRSVGACSSLRFNTFNIHASCSVCNNHLSGNIREYYIRLVNKIGQDKVDFLESENSVKHYDVEYLKRLTKIFNKRYRHLMKLKDAC